MIDAAYADAVALLTDHREELDGLAGVLLEREQVDRREIEDILVAINGGGRSTPSRADALPAPREPVKVPVAVPVAMDAAPRDGREPIVNRPLPEGPRRIPAIGTHRGRRVRSGVEAAAATVFAVTLPRAGVRRRRRKRAGIA